MFKSDLSARKQQFDSRGYCVISAQELPLVDAEWERLEAMVRDLRYKKIIGGDTGEGHAVWVSRLVNDMERPVVLQDEARAILDIVMSQSMVSFYKTFVGEDNLYVRRCQANVLIKGDYIGVHKDSDTNPDYMNTVIFYLDSEYRGGEFVSINPHEGKRRIKPGKHALVLHDCELAHEVLPVIEGRRSTLACFMSTYDGPTRTHRQAFRVENFRNLSAITIDGAR